MNDTNGPTEWSEMLRGFRSTKGLTQKDLATRSGLPIFTIRRIEKGEAPRAAEVTKLRDFFESLPVEDEKLPLIRHGLDETSFNLMARVIRHHKETNRLEGVAKNVISRLSVDKPEVVEMLATSLLRQYIASIPDAEMRHDRLLDLLGIGTNGR